MQWYIYFYPRKSVICIFLRFSRLFSANLQIFIKVISKNIKYILKFLYARECVLVIVRAYVCLFFLRARVCMWPFEFIFELWGKNHVLPPLNFFEFWGKKSCTTPCEFFEL